MALPYLTLVTFRARTLMATGEVDVVETDVPGFIDGRIAVWTSYLHSRLAKRYGKSLPFSNPVPETILGWLTNLVTLDTLRKRGLNPADPSAEDYRADVNRTFAEVKEAADSNTGLFDLPSPEGGASNVTTGGPLGYSETSPYVAFSKQATQGYYEDSQKDGTGDD